MGNFQTMPLTEVIDLLSRRRVSGSLTCERGSIRKSLQVRDGIAHSAASNDPREYLGQLLLNFNHVSEEQLAKAFQVQAQTKVKLGKVLVMANIVSTETVQQVLAIKIRETLLDVYLWDSGVFHIDDLASSDGDDGAEVPLIDIAREAEFRATVWEAVRGQFPTGTATLLIDESKAPQDLDPNSIDGRTLKLARDGLTIDEVGLALHANDFHLYQRLYALNRQGIVTAAPLPVARDGTGKVGEEVGATEVVDRARTFLKAKQFYEAEVVATRALEMAPHLESAKAILAEAQRALVSQLRIELLEPPKVPMLRLAAKEIAKKPFSAPEKYLLSRCNGSRDLKEIIQVAPLKELEVLKAFRKFAESGIVELR